MTDSGYIPQAVGPRTARAVRLRGPRAVAGDYVRWGSGLVAGLPWAARGHRGEFDFAGERHRYRYHPYKWSWLTERAVEVPIVQAIVDRYRGRRVLEVGHVLGHFAPQEHVIVDKYEHVPGVLNLDVFDLEQLGEFDLVVSISTVEHVGWDEEPREPEKAAIAMRSLHRLLAPGGELVVTYPVGYHPGLDAALSSGELSFDTASAMRRMGQNRWREVPPATVWGTPYDFLLYSARAVFIGRSRRPAADVSQARREPDLPGAQ